MRIIAGAHKGRRLRPPDRNAVTRPIPDRIKEALFSRLETRLALNGRSVLDLFAGTGSVGLEALSRGAGEVTFVERSERARRRLKANVQELGEGARGRIIGGSALTDRTLHDLATVASRRPFGLVFADPPYAMLGATPDREKLLNRLARLAPRCTADTPLILRTDATASPDPIPGWDGPEPTDYGSMVLHWYTRSRTV